MNKTDIENIMNQLQTMQNNNAIILNSVFAVLQYIEQKDSKLEERVKELEDKLNDNKKK